MSGIEIARLRTALAAALLLTLCQNTAQADVTPTPAATATQLKATAPDTAPVWRRLHTEAFARKQDDIYFADRSTGWYGNGKGLVYRTRDGGETWTKQWEQPGTFVRALGFVDADVGILGNIGPDSFPGATDPLPLYRTTDGGASWAPVERIDGPAPVGICAIDVLHSEYINAGVLDRRTTLRAGGRVGGPAFLATSRDLGRTWTSVDMSAHTAMILDVKFVNEQVGFIAGASHSDVAQSHARILKTRDGGRSWHAVYESQRPYEITWKMSFPLERVGYVTVQNYDPDTAVVQRYVAKTVDGGETWSELPLVADHKVREFGVGFVDELHGWVGATPNGFETRDGGKTWTPGRFGATSNKFRIVRDAKGISVFAIGPEVYKLELPAAAR